VSIERLAGPSTHICWTPDAKEPDEREQVVLVRAADLAKLERDEEGFSTFIPIDRLGAMENTLNEALHAPTKRRRGVAFREIHHLVTLLKMWPKGKEIHIIASAIDSNGNQGLYLSAQQPLRYLGQVPEKG
jgi:hypothetical protein